MIKQTSMLVFIDKIKPTLTERETEVLEALKQMEVKSGCDANDDGIPPNNKLLGILPTIL